jgi:hypothetical protein
MEFQVAGILQYGAVDLVYNPKYPEWHPEDVPIDKIFPVSLSEEWLLKFGFEKTISGALKKDIPKATGSFYFDKGKLLFAFGYYVEDFEETDIEFVHQFQNLYFALCFEELTLKELV